MTLDIKHPEKPTEADKIDDNDYMASHTITGKLPYSDVDIGDGIPQSDILGSGYQLIETKEISSQSSTTFSNLDGDEDEEYLIKFDCTIASPGSAAIGIILRPNAESGAYYSNTMDYDDYAGSLGKIDNWPNNKMYLCAYGWGNGSRAYGHAILNVKRSIMINMYSQFTDMIATPHYSRRNIHSSFSKIDTNITSLQLLTDGTSFSGEISLYKKI